MPHGLKIPLDIYGFIAMVGKKQFFGFIVLDGNALAHGFIPVDGNKEIKKILYSKFCKKEESLCLIQ